MDLTEWNAAYDEALEELEKRLQRHCSLIPPTKIPEVIRAIHKGGTVRMPTHRHDGEDGAVADDIIVKHTVYEKYGTPFLEFKALIRGTDFVFEINPLPKKEDEDGNSKEAQTGEQDSDT